MQRRDAWKSAGSHVAQESKCGLAKIFLSTASVESIESDPAILLRAAAIPKQPVSESCFVRWFCSRDHRHDHACGDPEMARRMIVEVDAARERLPRRSLVFLGKTVVYSAGCTFMAAFPREDRYLTDDATLLIHRRQLKQTMDLDGPLRSHLPKLTAVVHLLDTGIGLEEENFKRLVEGSDVSMDALLEKALYNW
jgi:hypothetical protein